MTNTEITPIKVSLPLKENNLKLYVISDLHLGDPLCDLDTAKRIIDFIKDTPECYCILLGDILNTAIKQSVSDVYTDTMNVAQAQKLAVELLTPIKDKILAITPGNHENRIWKEVGVDITLWLAAKLGIEDRYRNDLVALSVQFGSDLNNRPFRLNIFGQHGNYGSSRKLGGALNAIEDMDGIINNADIFVRGHTHSQVQGSRKVFFFNQLGNVESRMKYYYNSPSILNYGGYGAKFGYRPQNDDPAYLNIRAVSHRVGSKEEKKFLIDKVML